MMTNTQPAISDRQTRRRLHELEVAARLGGDAELAWHLKQAVRSGATSSNIVEAVKQGMELRGKAGHAVTPCADRLMDQRFAALSRPASQSVIEMASSC